MRKIFTMPLFKDAPFEETVFKTQIPTLDIIPSNQDLIGVEIEFVSLSNREKRLRNFLKKLTLLMNLL